MSCASSGHINKLKQSILAFRYLWAQRTFKSVNYYLNTNIYSYLETSGGQSSNLYVANAMFSLLKLPNCALLFIMP